MSPRNDEAARQGRPANANTPPQTVARPAAIPAVVRVLELIHDGRRFLTGDLPSEIVEEVVHVLEGIELEKLSNREQRHRCGNCGAVFDWPGDLDHHRRMSHWGQPWEVAA